MKEISCENISEMLITTSFNIFKEYVDKNNLLDEAKWDMSTRSRIFKEIKELYFWWVENYIEVEKEWERIHTEYPQFTILSPRETSNDPLIYEYITRIKNVINMEQHRKYEENHNLMRLIKIKNYI